MQSLVCRLFLESDSICQCEGNIDGFALESKKGGVHGNMRSLLIHGQENLLSLTKCVESTVGNPMTATSRDSL